MNAVTLPDGRTLPVIDAPLDALIEVRQKHIDKGVPGDPRNCALALAAHDNLGSDVLVFWKTRAILEVEIDGKPVMMRYEVRGKDTKFIEKFDGRGEPGDLRLSSPVHTVRLRRPVGKNRIGQSHSSKLGRPEGKLTGTRGAKVWVGPRGNFTLRARRLPVIPGV